MHYCALLAQMRTMLRVLWHCVVFESITNYKTDWSDLDHHLSLKKQPVTSLFTSGPPVYHIICGSVKQLEMFSKKQSSIWVWHSAVYAGLLPKIVIFMQWLPLCDRLICLQITWLAALPLLSSGSLSFFSTTYCTVKDLLNFQHHCCFSIAANVVL